MVGFLLANALIILANIFDFPPNAMRHLFTFVAAGGVFVSLLFIVGEILC
jgi:hypothetical protein